MLGVIEGDGHALGGVAVGEGEGVAGGIRAELGEGTRALREVKVGGWRLQVARGPEPVGDEADAHELVGLVVREVAEENAVDDGADADRGADPDAERGDDAGGESRRAVQATEREARVTGKIVERDDAARVARFLAETLCAAEAEKRGAPGVGVAHAAADVLRRFHFHMEGKLLVSARRRSASGGGTAPGRERARHARGTASGQLSAAMTRPTALTKRFQDASSCPARVAGGGEPVVLCAPAVLGDAPLRVDPASLLEPDERWVDGALAYLQRVLGELLDAVGESPSVHRRERERLEDEQVERALQDLFVGGGLGHGVLPNDRRKVASLLPNVKRTQAPIFVPRSEAPPSTPVGVDLREMERDVSVDLLEERNAITNQDREDRVPNFVGQVETKALGGHIPATDKPNAAECLP